MITDDRLPEVGCLSWIRVYHSGIFSDDTPADLLARAGAADLPLTYVDVNELEFFDIQALRHGHVARAKLPPVQVAGEIIMPGADEQPTVLIMQASVVTHLLVHQSGYVVLRPVIRFDSLGPAGGLTVAALHHLERTIMHAASHLEWRLPGLDRPMHGFARNYLNFVFLDLLARWSGELVHPARIAEWAVEGAHGCERLHELTRRGVLEHPFPVSFGTEIQVVLPRQPAPAAQGSSADEEWPDWNRRAAALAWAVLRPAGTAVDTPPNDFESDAQSVAWFMDEHLSLLVRADGHLDPLTDLVDRDRGQVTEFLALRRGALINVQRATQRVITERIAISRRQLARWQYLTATLTDDYVLHGRASVLLQPLKRNFIQDSRLRDFNDLERQVRSNLDWFQARIEASADWTGGLVGAVVGAAALAISLTEPVRIVLAHVTQVPVDDLADRYGLLLASAIAVVVALSFALSLGFVRHVSNRLRPLAGTKKARLTTRRPGRAGQVPQQRQPADSSAIDPEHLVDEPGGYPSIAPEVQVQPYRQMPPRFWWRRR